MKSITRYAVEVKGKDPTYWDDVHDAIINALTEVYCDSDCVRIAINELKAGRIAGWIHESSSVKIYPPENKTDTALLRQALEDICGARLCEFSSTSSRREMLRLMDKAIAALRERLGESDKC